MTATQPDAYALSAFPDQDAVNQTIRMVARVSAPGQWIRLRLSNRFGDRAMRLGTVRVARRALGPAVDAASDHLVSFHGGQGVTIPAGADVRSDPVAFPVNAGDQLAVSLYIVSERGGLTWHRYANSVSYVSARGTGDHTADPTGVTFQTVADSAFWLVGIDEAGSPYHGSVVTLGDSITDGYPLIPDQYQTWPDVLASRLEGPSAPVHRAVVNAGIAGNCLESSSYLPYGPSGVNRLGPDALDLPGVRRLIVFEGINDLSMGAKAPALINALAHIAATAHQVGVRVFVATITPRSDLTAFEVGTEPQREAVNHWIRTSHAFDGVFDFDRVVRDPLDHHQLAAVFDSGDHVHPNLLGLKAMADSINLALLG